MNEDRRRSVDLIQTVLILAIGVPFGIIPLAQTIFGSDPGFLFQRVFGEPEGAARWAIPLGVVAVIAVAVLVLDRTAKPR